MSSGGQSNASQTPFAPNYGQAQGISGLGAGLTGGGFGSNMGGGNAYAQKFKQPSMGGQGYGNPFGGYGGGYDQGYGNPFSGFGGGYDQGYGNPFSGFGGGYGGGYGNPFGGFGQPFALPQNPYNPYGSQQFAQQPPPVKGGDQPPPGFELNPEYRELPPGTIRSFGSDSIRYRPIQQGAQQPPPGMEVNPNYQPSNRLSQDVRPSDMQFRLQGEDTPKNPEPAPSSYGSTEKYKAIPDSPLNLKLQDIMRRLSENPSSAFGFAERLGGSPQGAQPFVPDERQLGPAIQPNPGFRGNFSDYGDAMRNQGIGFGNPYGGYGAPYGGNPYMGMFGGLGSLFGGNGFQGMNQQARAQQMALENQRQFPQGSFNPTSAEEYYRSFNANTMTQSYKNPNYDPNNPDSERYITIS